LLEEEVDDARHENFYASRYIRRRRRQELVRIHTDTWISRAGEKSIGHLTKKEAFHGVLWDAHSHIWRGESTRLVQKTQFSTIMQSKRVVCYTAFLRAARVSPISAQLLLDRCNPRDSFFGKGISQAKESGNSHQGQSDFGSRCRFLLGNEILFFHPSSSLYPHLYSLPNNPHKKPQTREALLEPKPLHLSCSRLLLTLPRQTTPETISSSSLLPFLSNHPHPSPLSHPEFRLLLQIQLLILFLLLLFVFLILCTISSLLFTTSSLCKILSLCPQRLR
jgi:hypothetical protein